MKQRIANDNQTLRFVLFITLLITGLCLPAHAADKIALIIANQHYQQSGATLQRPMADAQSMMQVLSQKGFQVYGGKVQTNLTRQRFEQTVKQFSRQARTAEVAVIYYAGHGTQDGKANYLIPVDAKIEKAVDYRYQAVELRFVLDYLGDSGVPVSLVFLDACRDNPFSGARGGSRGLLRVATPPEILVSYSTSQGATAQDQSPYTPALVRSIREHGGRNIYELMTNVAAEVVKVTGGKQRPDFSSSLTRNFCLAGCGPSNAAAPVVNNTPTATPPKPIQPPRRPATSVAINNHRHGTRSHGHVLPAAGLNHEHGNGVTATTGTVAVVNSPSPVRPTKDSREPEMVFIKGGIFKMGSSANEAGRRDNERQHSVTVGNFYLGKTEVTNAEYARCVSAGACKAPEWQERGSKYNLQTGTDKSYQGFTSPQQPVVGVSWHNAQSYAQWLSKLTGKRYSLPIEAQWEYAARAGTQTAYSWGNAVSRSHVNYGAEKCCEGKAAGADRWVKTAPVGSFPANRFGLRDMMGNVFEWACSAYEENYDGSEQRCAPNNDARERVLRGGSWSYAPESVRSAYRNWDAAANRFNDVGFRLSRTP